MNQSNLPADGRRSETEQRFVVSLGQTRHGKPTWVVRGFTRAGKRVREYHRDGAIARLRASELEAEYNGNCMSRFMRPTELTHEQLAAAEDALRRIPDLAEFKDAVNYWLKFGRRFAADRQAPKLKAAIQRFVDWLPTSGLRPKTQAGYAKFLDRFAQEAGDVPLQALHPDFIGGILKTRWPNQPTSRHNTRIALSRFCSWAMESERAWFVSNPASGKAIKTRPSHADRQSDPQIFSLRQVVRLLAAGRRFRQGKYLKFLVLSLFCGLRPAEALRVRSDQPDLSAGELRIEPRQSKTKRSRMVHLPDVAVHWLKACPEGVAGDWTKSRTLWSEFKRKAKIKEWPFDGLRHTALSYFFRAEGSYGLTAEWAGNSEGIVKAHYQGRVKSEEADLFWTLYPERAMRRQARAKLGGQPSRRAKIQSGAGAVGGGGNPGGWRSIAGA